MSDFIWAAIATFTVPGKDQGRNGIGIDPFSDRGDAVSRNYFAQVRGAGRVVESYQPQKQ